MFKLLPVVAIVLASISLLSQTARAEQTEHKIRISRPQSNEVHAALDAKPAVKSNVGGLSTRWWRKFKNPSFCPYMICGSSCADISGMPRIGSYSQDELMSGDTPCGLKELNALEKPASCCMPDTVDHSYSCPEESCTEAQK